MVPKGTLETVARIVEYDRFHCPSIDKFKDGFEYEYVQLAFKKVLSHLPIIDRTGRHPTCTYKTHWTKGVWGTAFGINDIKHMSNKIKFNEVRVRTPLKTSYLRELLEENPLSFKINKLHIVIFPKKELDREIYINGVQERTLRGKRDSKLYQSWFVKWSDSPLQKDWRYLLGLDFPEQPPTDQLYLNFDGVFTGDKEKFKNIEENFIKGYLGDNFTPAPVIRDPKRRAKKVKKIPENKPIGLIRHHNPKIEAELSAAVIEARKRAQTRRAKQKAKRIARDLSWGIARNEKNQEDMDKLRTVCIESQLTKKIFRVPEYKADKYCQKWFRPVRKNAYKLQDLLERDERKAIAEKKYEVKEVERPPVLSYVWDEELEKWVHTPHSVSKITILAIPNYDGIGRAGRRVMIGKRSEPKQAKQPNSYYQYIEPKYILNDDLTPKTEEIIRICEHPLFEMVPVMKREWKMIYNEEKEKFEPVRDENGKMILLSEKPWILPGLGHIHKWKVSRGKGLVNVFNNVSIEQIREKIRRILKTKPNTILVQRTLPKRSKRR